MEKIIPSMTNDPVVNNHRAATEQRARWMYLLLEAAEKKGVPADFAREAIFKCGCLNKAARIVDAPDFTSFLKASFTDLVNKAWEEEVTWGENEVFVENHYCPLLAAWQELTDDDEKLKELCDIAMEGDRGLFNNELMEFKLERTLGEGAPTCQMRFIKK